MVQYLKCLSVLPTFLVLTNSEYKSSEKSLLSRLLILIVLSLLLLLVMVFVFWEREREGMGEGERKGYLNRFICNFIM